MIRVLAAGSLKAVWSPLMDAFSAQSGVAVSTGFGPAGLLCQRIANGEPCDVFASANLAHPQALAARGQVIATGVFAANRLCLTVARHLVRPGDDWFSLLTRPALRLGTSTPGCDPCGDYTWQLFDALEHRQPGFGAQLKGRARQLVGGPGRLSVPAGQMAASWLINTGKADMFIGYASYAPRLRMIPAVQVVTLPDEINVAARYGYGVCHPRGQPLAAYLCSDGARQILGQAGFTLP